MLALTLTADLTGYQLQFKQRTISKLSQCHRPLPRRHTRIPLLLHLQSAMHLMQRDPSELGECEPLCEPSGTQHLVCSFCFRVSSHCDNVRRRMKCLGVEAKQTLYGNANRAKYVFFVGLSSAFSLYVYSIFSAESVPIPASNDSLTSHHSGNHLPRSRTHQLLIFTPLLPRDRISLNLTVEG